MCNVVRLDRYSVLEEKRCGVFLKLRYIATLSPSNSLRLLSSLPGLRAQRALTQYSIRAPTTLDQLIRSKARLDSLAPTQGCLPTGNGRWHERYPNPWRERRTVSYQASHKDTEARCPQKDDPSLTRRVGMNI